MKLASIIVVNWNGKNYLEKCLDSLKKLIYPNYEIVLVDNGSVDGSVEFVRQNFPWIKIVQNKENLGFAEANNIGYQNSKGEYILFLNNDTTVEPNFLTILVKEIEINKDIGGLQPKILQMDNPQKLDCVGGFLTASGILYHFGYGKNADNPKYSKKIEIFSAKGAAILFRREVLEKVGLFDKDFFAYFEETDLCHRVWVAGYKIIYIPDAVIYHKGKGTAKRIGEASIAFHSFKNRINSYLKNLGTAELLKILPLHLCLCEIGAIFYYLFWKRDSDLFLAIQKAIIWNIQHLGETLKKRREVQKDIRKIKDKDFIPKLKKKVRLSYYYYLPGGPIALANYEDYYD